MDIRKITVKHYDDDIADVEEPKKGYRESDDPDMYILNSLISQVNNVYSDDRDVVKKKKKKDKEKNKDKKKDKEKKKKKKGKKSLLSEHGLGDLFGERAETIINGKELPKMDKNSEDFYEYRFSSSLILLKDLLKQVNGLMGDSKDLLDTFKKSGARGSFTALTNQTSNMATLLNTKLSVIKEITSVNKSISDLELKTAAKKSADGKGSEHDDEFIMDQLFSKLMNSDITGSAESKKKKKKKDKDKDDADDDDFEEYYDQGDVDELLDAKVRELVDVGEIEFTDNEMAFKYETNPDIRIIINKCVTNGNWEFMAIDGSDEEIDDYPLPSKKSVGKMKFDDDKASARDSLGNVYEIRYFR